MPLRSPPLARFIILCLTISICFCMVAAQPKHRPSTHLVPHSPPKDIQPALICKPFGDCEPCPDDSRSEPFCQPFGNRRLMHCLNSTSHSSEGGSNDTDGSPLDHQDSQHSKGEMLAWESCGRIVGQERADFYEFVGCNILFAAVALFILFARSKRLQARQARHLAARIGLIRTGGRR